MSSVCSRGIEIALIPANVPNIAGPGRDIPSSWISDGIAVGGVNPSLIIQPVARCTANRVRAKARLAEL